MGLDLDDEGILEVRAVVDFFNGGNAVASNPRILYEPPMFAGI